MRDTVSASLSDNVSRQQEGQIQKHMFVGLCCRNRQYNITTGVTCQMRKDIKLYTEYRKEGPI